MIKPPNAAAANNFIGPIPHRNNFPQLAIII